MAIKSLDLNDEVIAGKRVAFAGKLGSMNRREAFRLVRQGNGHPVESLESADVVVIGADEIPLDDDELLGDAIRDAAAEGRIRILHETELWDQLGVVEKDQDIRRLYTPAMLAQLLNVKVSIIRRWHRRGLIVPKREVHRLPYFDFQEVATARRLADLLTAGASPKAIESKLEQLSRLVPGVERPLAQLSVIVEGREILLRKGEGLVEPGGQMRLDFEAPISVDESEVNAEKSVIQIRGAFSSEHSGGHLLETAQLVAMAGDLEDDGQYADAIEIYRAALMSGGVDAEISFRLAELLYIEGDLAAARERYSMAVELDEDFVEARANLGCLLAELGDPELAIAAFQGALKHHPDYPDAHYHMARILDDLGDHDQSSQHWHRFVTLSPNSPWAAEALQRLGIEDDQSS